MEASNFLPVMSRILLPFLSAVILGLSPVPQRVLLAYQQIHEALRDENPAQAAARMEEIAANLPWHHQLWEQAGLLYMSGGEDAAGVEMLEKADQSGVLSPDGYLVLADGYERLGRLPEAVAIWREHISTHLVREELFDRIVSAEITLGGEEELIGVYETWIEQYPEEAVPYYQLGLWQLLTEPQKGMGNLARAVELNSDLSDKVEILMSSLTLLNQDDPQSYRLILIGRTLGNATEWDMAKRAFEKAIELEPTYAEAWAYLGEALQQVGQPALAAIEKANELSPESVLVKAITSLYWRRQNQPEKAIEVLEQIRKENPDEEIWLVELANVYAQKGDLSSAVAFFAEAILNEPENPAYWKELVVFCLQNHYEIRNMALPSARQVVILEHESSQSLDLMGLVMMSLEDYFSARRYFTWALEKDGSNGSAHLHLGQLLLMQNDLAGAHNHLTQAVLNEPDHSQTAIKAKQLIEQYLQGSQE